MKNRDQVTYRQFEGAILAEIEDITARIRDLNNQKQSLEQVLVRARQKDALIQRTDVTRRNSVNRVLVEGAILKSLESAQKPVTVKSLLLDARLMVPTLLETTFRSHLFRMKARGMIEQAGFGKWKMASSGGLLQSATADRQSR